MQSSHNDIDETRELQRHLLGFVGCEVFLRLLAVEIGINQEIDNQQQDTRDEPFKEHILHPPSKARAFLEQQEQGRVAERRQQAAAVGHDRDEEEDSVHLVLTLRDGLQHQAYQQHGSSRGTHERGQEPANAKDNGVGERFCHKVTLDADAAGGNKQRHQQQDEGDIVKDHLMNQFVTHAVHAKPNAHGHAEDERHIQFVKVVFTRPPWAAMARPRCRGASRRRGLTSMQG